MSRAGVAGRWSRARTRPAVSGAGVFHDAVRDRVEDRPLLGMAGNRLELEVVLVLHAIEVSSEQHSPQRLLADVPVGPVGAALPLFAAELADRSVYLDCRARRRDDLPASSDAAQPPDRANRIRQVQQQ